MKKISTVQVFGSEIFKEQQLTIGVDLIPSCWGRCAIAVPRRKSI
jgi:hypothetical protein